MAIDRYLDKDLIDMIELFNTSLLKYNPEVFEKLEENKKKHTELEEQTLKI